MSRVSVIIPCYMYAHYLRECVESVLSQDGVELSILIIDDASTDNTPDVATALVAEDPRIECRRHSVNLGNIATYNEGFAWADGDYVLLISADDLLTPGALRRAARLMDMHPEVGLVYGGVCKLVNGETRPNPRIPLSDGTWKIWNGLEWFTRACKTARTDLISPEVVVRTTLLQQLGGYKPELPYYADQESYMSFAMHAEVGEVVDADQAYYRIHSSNMHRNADPRAGFEQWKLAYDRVFENYKEIIPRARNLQGTVSRRIAREAMGCACGHIDRHQITSDEAADLLDFALKAHPRARLSLEYLGLRLRMLIGPRVSPVPRLIRRD